VPSLEYARLRDLWNRYQSGYPGIDGTVIRDVTSMDGVIVYDSAGRPSTDPSFEDNLRRPWQNTSAWADYGVQKGFVRSADALAASVELWETGVLFQEPGKIRSFTGLAAPSGATAQSSSALVPSSQGGVFTGAGSVANQGAGSPIILDGEITRSSLPTREMGETVAGAGMYLPVSETYSAQFAPGAAPGGGMPSWLWIAIVGAIVYFATRES
jgi:hypothetical protein